MSRQTRTTTAADTAENPATPSNDPRSEAAPGVRTEAEVIADEQAAAERAANEAPPGVTGNPLNESDVPEERTDKLVHYVRESDGTVQSVNEGSPEHAVLESGAEWKKTTRAKAKAFTPRTFPRTAKAKA